MMRFKTLDIDLNKIPAVFTERYNHILESENAIALSEENFERIDELVLRKQGLYYDELLYRDYCNKSLERYSDKKDMFDVEFGINLYEEYEKIQGNNFDGLIPAKDTSMYKFLAEFGSEIVTQEREYTTKDYVYEITSYMFSIIYDYEVKKIVHDIGHFNLEFTNENEKLSKFVMDEIDKFIIIPWVKMTGYIGIVGDEDIIYALDELVAQSYCKTDFDTVMAVHVAKAIVMNNIELNFNLNIDSKIKTLREMFESNEHEGSVYSDNLINLSKDIYEIYLTTEVENFINNNK
ncbi:MAG: hypothetical protein ACRC41_16485 [Sarcina sp.]